MERSRIGPILAEEGIRFHDDCIRPLLTSRGDVRSSITLDFEPLAGLTARVPRYSEKNWARLMERLANDEAAYVELRLETEEAPPSPSLTVIVKLGGPDETGIAHQVIVSVDHGVVPDPALPGAIVSRACLLATRIEAVAGYIDHHWGPFIPTRFEAGMSLEATRSECFRLVHGYFWGNFLGPGHLQALGGRERTLRECPSAVVEDLSSEGHELVYAQLTEDVEEVTEEKLAALRDFLDPVLPRGARSAGQIAELRAALSEALSDPHATPAEIGAAYGRAWFRRPVGAAAEGKPPPSDATEPPPREPFLVERLEGWSDEPDVAFTLVLERPLSEEEHARLEKLLSSWYHLGASGAFEGHFHFMHELAFHEEEGEHTAEWLVDCGSANVEAAVDPLVRAFQTLARDGDLPIRKLILGMRVIE